VDRQRRDGQGVDAAEPAMEPGEPRSGRAPDSPIPDLPQRDPGNALDEQPGPAGLGQRAEQLRRSESGGVEHAIGLQLASRIVPGSLDQLGGAVEPVEAQVLERELDAAAVGEHDVQLLEGEARPVRVRAALDGDRPPAGAPGELVDHPTPDGVLDGRRDRAHGAPPRDSSSAVSTRSESRYSSAIALAAAEWPA
jgi:hypothetical protein